jgi:hypothetical protein
VSEHEDIARRLREEGPAPAPPDLADEVMAQVRAEPRRRRRRAPRVSWRPVLGWAAAAVVLVAVGFGIARLPGGGSSSSASSSAPAAASGGGATRATPSKPLEGAGTHAQAPPAYTVSRAVGFRILSSASTPGSISGPNSARPVVTVRVPPAAYKALRIKLARAQRRYQDSPSGRRIVIRLIQAGTR